MKRRNFFKSIAKAAAIVALAPQLCFRAKAEVVCGWDIDGSYICILNQNWLGNIWFGNTKELVCYEHGFIATTPQNPFL